MTLTALPHKYVTVVLAEYDKVLRMQYALKTKCWFVRAKRKVVSVL
jgi:hypothetical protein